MTRQVSGSLPLTVISTFAVIPDIHIRVKKDVLIDTRTLIHVLHALIQFPLCAAHPILFSPACDWDILQLFFSAPQFLAQELSALQQKLAEKFRKRQISECIFRFST